jgi:hypothetical protein
MSGAREHLVIALCLFAGLTPLVAGCGDSGTSPPVSTGGRTVMQPNTVGSGGSDVNVAPPSTGGGGVSGTSDASVAGLASDSSPLADVMADALGSADALPLAPGCAIYAAPVGSGSVCTNVAPCSLEGARDKVRTLNAGMKADLEVCLAGGTYKLAQTFTLTENATVHDSGTGGFNVIYRPLGAEPPVLSGGRVITGFAVADQGKNIWRAHVGTDLHSRQLFVNDRRAQRARSKDNLSMTLSDHGFTARDASMAAFKNPTHIEVVGNLDWRHYRCPVDSISGNLVRLQDPCWALSQDINGGWWNFKAVLWVENAYELLDEDGEFYLDEVAGDLYYKPRQGEDMKTATVAAPVLETLVKATGTIATPLHNVVFRGLTFSHGTWYEPSTSVGYTSWQSGFLHRTLKQYYDSGFFVAPSNLVFETVESLRFEGNRFTNLGANGVEIFHASNNNVFVGNRFDGISGRAITLGHLDDYNAPAAEVIKNNTFKNNYIAHSGVEYLDCSIFFIGYTQDTVIQHNWLRYGPYIGISLGWGWASHPDNTAGNNLIQWNRIEDFMSMTFDGSGVYALGPQHGSSVDHNYIYRGLADRQNPDQRGGEGIFPDQGAAYMSWESNVIRDVGWQWIHDWSDAAHHNVIRDNFTNQPRFEHGGTKANDVFTNNQVITNDSWPQAANDIMAKAGLEAAYSGIAQ